MIFNSHIQRGFSRANSGLETESKPKSSMGVAIWAAIIASIIRPVVGTVSPVVTSIARISVVTTTMPVTGVTVITTIPIAAISVAVTTPLRYIAIYAIFILRVCRRGSSQRNRKREDERQRQ